MAQPGSPPRRMQRPAAAGTHGPGHGHARQVRQPERPPRPGWQDDAFAPADTDTDLPSWAGPAALGPAAGPARASRPADPYDGGYAGEARRAGPAAESAAVPDEAGPAAPGARTRAGRAAAARRRRSRRLIRRWAAVAIALCVVGAGIAAIVTATRTRQLPYVTSMQPGEYKSVPSACTSISAGVLSQYLPGNRTQTNQFAGSQQSQCSFTVDAKPVFRLLEVSAQAYQPFAAATGNGSASANAQDNVTEARAELATPPKNSPLSPATITALAGFGQEGFTAVQHEQAAGTASNVVTLVARDRNVVVTVVMQGEQAPGFTAVPVATLELGARAAAKDMLARAGHEPAA